MGKSNIQLFSKETNELLKRGGAKEFEKLNKEARKLTDQINQQTKVLKNAKQGTKEYAQEYQRLINTTKNLMGVAGQRNEFAGMAKNGMAASPAASASGGGGGGLMGMVGGLMSNPLSWLIGAGLFGGHEAMKGFGMWQQGAGTRISLRGRGMRQIGLRGGQTSAAALYGMNENDFIAQQMASMDAFGSGGATNASVLGRSRFERGRGLATGTLTSTGAGLATQLGGRGSQDAIMKLQASLIASGIKDRIGPYLEVAANMLTSINAQGLSSSGQVLGALASIAAKSKDAPEIISSVLMGLDSSVRNATGEKAAFFQNAFAKAGIGGGTILGTQLSMKGGMFGVDTAGLTPEWAGLFERSGLSDKTGGFQQKAKAIVDMARISKLDISGKDTMGGQAALSVGQQIFGTSDTKKVAKGWGYLQMGAEGGDASKWADKIKGLKDKTGEENLTSIQSSSEGSYTMLTKIRDTLLIGIGKDGVKLASEIEKALINIDKNIAAATALITPLFGWINKTFPAISPEDIQTSKEISQGKYSDADGKFSYENMSSKETNNLKAHEAFKLMISLLSEGQYCSQSL